MMVRKKKQWVILQQLLFAIVLIFLTICCDETNLKQPTSNQTVQSGSGSGPTTDVEPMEPIYPCPDHIFPFCTDENPFGISYKSATTGYAAFPKSANIGCLITAPGPTWYYMQIDHPGDLLIYIEQTSILIKLDVDFACWGPFEADSKKEFLDKICSSYYKLNVEPHPNHRPEGGNHQGDTGGYPFGNLVDCSYDPAGTEWCYIPNAKKGEWYLLLLTNYSRQKGTIHFERDDEVSTATTNCEIVTPITLHPIPSGLLKIDDHTSAICLYEDKALVTIELEAEEGYTLPKRSLPKCEVNIYANNRSYQATLVKDHFECEIDIVNDTTNYYAIITCPDPKFEVNTENYSIIRTTDCDPDLVKFTEVSPYHAGDLTTIELVKGDKPINVDFSDPNGVLTILPGSSEGLNLNDYDIHVDFDDLLIERVDIKKDGNVVKLTPISKGEWCDCFVPDSMEIHLRLIPNSGNIHAKPYEIPIQIGIIQPTVWVQRCLWVIILIGALLLFMLYLIALMRKNRFHKKARMKTSYCIEDSFSEIEKNGRPLRKPGLGAWINRWFNPFTDERNTISFTRPKTSPITFVASNSKNRILMTEDSFNDKTMIVPNYVPKVKDKKKKKGEPIYISTGTSIEIKKTQGSTTTTLGHLKFINNGKDDEGGFKLFLIILIIIDIIILGILTVLMINGM